MIHLRLSKYSISIQTENKNGSGTIDKAISLLPTVVATPEPMETQQTARHMLQVTAPSSLPEVSYILFINLLMITCLNIL